MNTIAPSEQVLQLLNRKKTDDTLKEGMSVKHLLEYTNAKLNMETVMVTIMEAITNGVKEVTFTRVFDVHPKVGDISDLQIPRLKELGYNCPITILDIEEVCIVTGW